MAGARYMLAGLCVGLLLAPVAPVSAHFLALIPSRAVVDQPGHGRLRFDLRFTHPMTGGPVMPIEVPAGFYVLGPSGRQDLLDTLRPGATAGTYQAEYRLRRPGDHWFVVEPRPYWEATEQRLIKHYTKVPVSAFGGAAAWDQALGLPLEIVPLSRPYGLWTGNLFRAEVRRDGRPLAYARVEVEWLNDGSLEPPADAYRTQVVHADANGVFAYAMPRAGWWGFAALVEDAERGPAPDGRLVPVELGGVTWVFARDMR